MGVPVLSICYGFQTIIKQFGGVVSKGDIKEFGYVKMDVTTKDVLLANLADDSGQTEAWMSHGDKVTKLAEGFTVNIKHAKLSFRFYSSHRQAFFWCAISP